MREEELEISLKVIKRLIFIFNIFNIIYFHLIFLYNDILHLYINVSHYIFNERNINSRIFRYGLII